MYFFCFALNVFSMNVLKIFLIYMNFPELKLNLYFVTRKKKSTTFFVVILFCWFFVNLFLHIAANFHLNVSNS